MDSPNIKAGQLMADVDRMTGSACQKCQVLMCPHDIVVSVAMGFKDRPYCTGCLAGHLGQELDVFRDRLHTYIQRHDCFTQGWSHASSVEETDRSPRSTCHWRGRHPAATGPTEVDPALSTRLVDDHPVHSSWDAGDMSCGDLVLELRMRLKVLRSHETLKLVAQDSAAPEDIPAWCNLTGNVLIQKNHPHYLIMKG